MKYRLILSFVLCIWIWQLLPVTNYLIKPSEVLSIICHYIPKHSQHGYFSFMFNIIKNGFLYCIMETWSLIYEINCLINNLLMSLSMFDSPLDYYYFIIIVAMLYISFTIRHKKYYSIKLKDDVYTVVVVGIVFGGIFLFLYLLSYEDKHFSDAWYKLIHSRPFIYYVIWWINSFIISFMFIGYW